MKKPTIGDQLLAERKKCNLTQAELYAKSNVAISTIGALEQNRQTETSTYTLRQLSKSLNNYKFIL